MSECTVSDSAPGSGSDEEEYDDTGSETFSFEHDPLAEAPNDCTIFAQLGFTGRPSQNNFFVGTASKTPGSSKTFLIVDRILNPDGTISYCASLSLPGHDKNISFKDATVDALADQIQCSMIQASLSQQATAVILPEAS